MVTKHLTDDEVQQYAVDKHNCDITIVEHIHFCDNFLKSRIQRKSKKIYIWKKLGYFFAC